jgi:hypothetical protein
MLLEKFNIFEFSLGSAKGPVVRRGVGAGDFGEDYNWVWPQSRG